MPEPVMEQAKRYCWLCLKWHPLVYVFGIKTAFCDRVPEGEVRISRD